MFSLHNFLSPDTEILTSQILVYLLNKVTSRGLLSLYLRNVRDWCLILPARPAQAPNNDMHLTSGSPCAPHSCSLKKGSVNPQTGTFFISARVPFAGVGMYTISRGKHHLMKFSKFQQLNGVCSLKSCIYQSPLSTTARDWPVWIDRRGLCQPEYGLGGHKSRVWGINLTKRPWRPRDDLCLF